MICRLVVRSLVGWFLFVCLLACKLVRYFLSLFVLYIVIVCYSHLLCLFLHSFALVFVASLFILLLVRLLFSRLGHFAYHDLWNLAKFKGLNMTHQRKNKLSRNQTKANKLLNGLILWNSRRRLTKQKILWKTKQPFIGKHVNPSTNDFFKVPWAAPVRCATMAGQVNVNVQAINGAVLHLQEGKSCKSMVLRTGMCHEEFVNKSRVNWKKWGIF